MSLLSSPTASTGGIWSLLNANNNNNNKTNKKTSGNTSGNGSSSNDKSKGAEDEGAVKGNTSGPALQRLVVVGNSMSGKRTFIDRLQRAAAQIASASASSGPAAPHHGAGSGAGRAGGAAAARAQQKATIAEERRAELTVGTIIPKSSSATARGSGLYYNSIAYHNVGAELLECLAAVTATNIVIDPSSSSSSSLPDTTATKKAALAADSSASSAVTLTKLLSSPEEYSVVEEGNNDEEKDKDNNNESLTQSSSATAANHLVIETIQKHSLHNHHSHHQQQHSLLAPAGSPSSCYHAYLVAAGQQQGGGSSGGARHTLTSSSTSSAPSSSSAAALSSPLFSQLLTLNNAVVEVIACDVAECLEAALPSYSSLQRTAVVIAVDGLDIANSSSTIQYWSSVINDQVRTLCSSHANNTKEGSAAAGVSGANSSKGSPSADPRVSAAASAADVGALASLRSLELTSAKKAFKAVTSSAYTSKSGGTSSTTVVIPQSLQILIPAMIVLTKTDLLEDACKNSSSILQQQQQQQGSSGSNDSSSNGEQLFSSAIHHVRWLALQRGSAFLALSSTKQYTADISGPGPMPSSSVVGAAAVVSAGGGGSTDLFASLWYYIVYGLLPNGLETFEFLQAKQNQLRQRLLRSVGGAGIDSAVSAAAESTQAVVDLQLSSNSLYSAGRRGKNKTDGEGGGEERRRGGATSDGEEDAEDGDDDSYTNSRSYNFGGGGGYSSASFLAREQRKKALANHRRRVIYEIISASIFNDPYIRPHILFFQPFSASASHFGGPTGANSSGSNNNANKVIPHTSSASAVFVPRGLDNPSFIERQAASSAYISVRFSSISTSGLSEIHKIVAETLSQPPPPSNSQSSSSTSQPQQHQQQQLTSAEVTRKNYEIFAIQMSQELAIAANARGAAALSTASPPPPFQTMIDATAGAGSMSTNNGLLPNTQPLSGGGASGMSPNAPYQQQYNINQHPSSSSALGVGAIGGGHAAGSGDVTSSLISASSAAAENAATATAVDSNHNNEVRGGGAEGDVSTGDEAMIWDE